MDAETKWWDTLGRLAAWTLLVSTAAMILCQVILWMER